MKKVFTLVLIMLMSLILVGCDEVVTQEDATALAVETTPTEPPATTTVEPPTESPAPTTGVAVEPPATTEPEPISELASDSLVGTWYWMGSPYYILYDNGEGTMSGSAIRWAAADGILSICNTPAICSTTCLAPAEWHYIIEGDELTLTSTLVALMTFTYTRR